ncbi:hypothetical protein BDD12DRAFT_810684 [Trichophaea hybrida]|nr:hypothetical protein BDD12DRAFT_810684 [Trichophaea hybrida]
MRQQRGAIAPRTSSPSSPFLSLLLPSNSPSSPLHNYGTARTTPLNNHPHLADKTRNLRDPFRTTTGCPPPIVYTPPCPSDFLLSTNSAESLPTNIQYLYRHPINVHHTFLTISGDFLRRRFESIEKAIEWIDERDREREISEALEGTSISTSTPDPVPPRKEEEEAMALVTELQELRGKEIESMRRGRRASDPVYRYSLQSPARGKGKAGGGGVVKAEQARVVAVKAKYGMSHLGVRRRELLYSLVVADEDEEKIQEERRRREMESWKRDILGGIVGVGGPTGLGGSGEGGGGGAVTAMEVEEEL